MPERLTDTAAFPGGEGYVIGITHEEVAATKPVVDTLLELVGGDPTAALIVAAHHLNATISYFFKEDVERVLGFTVSDEEWQVLYNELSHYDEHIAVCSAPLAHVFIRDCYDQIHAVDDWKNHPPLLPMREAAKNLKWQLVG